MLVTKSGFEIAFRPNGYHARRGIGNRNSNNKMSNKWCSPIQALEGRTQVGKLAAFFVELFLAMAPNDWGRNYYPT